MGTGVFRTCCAGQNTPLPLVWRTLGLSVSTFHPLFSTAPTIDQMPAPLPSSCISGCSWNYVCRQVVLPQHFMHVDERGKAESATTNGFTFTSGIVLGECADHSPLAMFWNRRLCRYRSYYYTVHILSIQVQLWKFYVYSYVICKACMQERAEQLHNVKNISEMYRTVLIYIQNLSHSR